MFIFACSDQLDDFEQTTNEPEVIENWLSFDSKNSLNEFLEDKKNISFDSYKQIIRKFEDKHDFKSVIHLRQDITSEEFSDYKNYRFKDYHEIINKHFPNAKINQQEVNDKVDLEEDLIVADPYYASLLNRKREILVEGSIYKYTELGLFFTNKDNYDNLDKEIAKFDLSSARLSSYNENEILQLGNGVNYFAPVRIDDQADVLKPCTDCGSPGSGVRPKSPKILTKEEFIDQISICNWDPNIWDDIFGPSQNCIDKFEKDKRIKLKAWSQNYLIYASIGVKVKSQNRFMGIWWAEKIDELELGIDMATFKYSFPGMEIYSPPTMEFEYDNYKFDERGHFLGHIDAPWFKDFPFKPKEEITHVNVKLPSDMKTYLSKYLNKSIDDIDISLTGKDMNDFFKKTSESIFKNVSKFLNKEINAPISISSPSDKQTIQFYFSNWKINKTGDNKIVDQWDLNTAQVGFKSKGNGDNTFLYKKPQSYKDFSIICYGIGRRGNQWKGSKLVLVNK